MLPLAHSRLWFCAGILLVAGVVVGSLMPGDYEVVVRKKGYQEFKKAISLQSRHDEAMTVSLTEESGSIFSSPFFWGATGAVVAAAAVTTVLIVTSNSGPFVICIAKEEALCRK